MALGQTVISATDAEQTIHYTITVSNKPTAFENGHIYLVGNRDYSTGVSSSGTSWNNPTQSFEFLHEVADASYKKQYKGEFTFEANDEFKFRIGPTDTDWLNELYCEENDVYGTGKAISRTALDANFVVGTGGDYDIYFKIGFDDGMSISIVERVAPQLHIDKTELTVQVGHTGTIKASDWVGELDAISGDTSKATVSKAADGTITVTGVAVGTVDISIKDDERTLHCTVTVQSEPVSTIINIYFTDPWGTGGNDMYFYTWKGSANNGWKTHKMTFVKLNEYNQGIFTCQVDTSVYENVIFVNEGDSQSPDISLVGVSNNTGFYIDGGVVHSYPYVG